MILKRIFLTTLGILLCSPAFAQYPAPKPQINVTGEAEVLVVPDEVVLSFGVETYDRNLTVAKQANDEIVKKAMAITKDMKIEPKHVQTDFVQVEPTYNSYPIYDEKRIQIDTVTKLTNYYVMKIF